MATTKIKPLGDRVLVEPLAAEERTASGIIIPDTAKEKPQRGTVIAVGAGTKDVTMDEVDYLIMKQGDILAVI